jgi:hypothetical protein
MVKMATKNMITGIFVVVLCVMMMVVSVSADTLEENIIAFCEGLNKENSADAEWHRQYFREDGELNWHFHADHMRAPTVEAVAAVHGQFWKDMPDLKLTVLQIFSTGDNVGLRIQATTEERGISEELAGIFTGIGGKIKLGRWYTDYSHLFKELGTYDPCGNERTEL